MKMKAQLDSNQKAITKKIRALVPDATAIIFHGSRVRGLPSPTSDYDVMVFTPTGMEPEDRERIKETLQRTFPTLKIDPIFGTERWLLAHLYMEPYYRFWLENGIAAYGQIPQIERYPLLHRGALDSRLDILRAEARVVHTFSKTLYQEGLGYLDVLKQLILIENALHGDYRNESLWAKVEQAIGDPAFEILRNPSYSRRIRKSIVNRLRWIIARKISALRKENLQSHLTTPKFPEQGEKHVEPQR